MTLPLSRVLLVLVFCFITSVQSFAQALDNPYVRRTSVGSDRIEGLKWDDAAPTFRIEPATASQPSRVLVLVAGRYQREEWRLLAKNRVLSQVAGGFRFWFSMNSPKIELEFLAIGPFGQVQRERVLFEVSGVESTGRRDRPVLEPSKAKVEVLPRSKRYVFSPGIGLSILGYRETGVPNVDQIGITGKASAVYILNSAWDVGLSGYLTLASIAGAGAAKETARFLGVNARAGYSLPFVKQPWKMAVLAGWFYTTMFVEVNQFGFSNMAGPQLFPTLRYTFPNGASGWLYGKYSPVSEGVALSFTNRELAFGGGYAFKPESGPSLSLTLDIAELGLRVDGKVITSNSVSVGVGMSL